MTDKIEIQAGGVDIKKECREEHGVYGALDEAITYITDKYKDILDSECNKDATVKIKIFVER